MGVSMGLIDGVYRFNVHADRKEMYEKTKKRKIKIGENAGARNQFER